jgi:hypothetical protein
MSSVPGLCWLVNAQMHFKNPGLGNEISNREADRTVKYLNYINFPGLAFHHFSKNKICLAVCRPMLKYCKISFTYFNIHSMSECFQY